MKLIIRSKIVLMLLLIPAIVFAEVDTVTKHKHSKEKSITKTYDVDANATLKVQSSFGNIDVITWNQNRIEFDITIKVSGNKEDVVIEKLNEIDVEFSNTENTVAAKTLFGENKSKSWWSWGKKNKLKIEVNYVIKMPMTNNVNLNNDYGNINLDKLEGKARLNCDYGKITTKELMADDNIINFDYSHNCFFEYIKSGRITADYSDYTVAKSKNLKINADYTKSIIEATENITYNCDYGSLKIENVNNIEGNGDYLTLRLRNVFKNVKVNANYGSIKIDRMASNAGNIEINSGYTGITIGRDTNYNFDFQIALDYGSLRGTDGFNFTNKVDKSVSKRYSGYYGNQGSGNNVKIKSEFGSVTFKSI